jgi:hypothetical protein
MLTHALTLNKELTEEEADVLAHICLQYLSRTLLDAAKELNLKVTIDLVHSNPPSTGDVEPRVEIRHQRILNDKGAYAKPTTEAVKRVLNSLLGPHTLAHVLFDAQQELKKKVAEAQRAQ